MNIKKKLRQTEFYCLGKLCFSLLSIHWYYFLLTNFLLYFKARKVFLVLLLLLPCFFYNCSIFVIRKLYILCYKWYTLQYIMNSISSVQSLSRVRLFAAPCIATSLSITISQSSLRLTSIESVMPSSHLILGRPLFCPQSLPASESFPMSQLFAWGSHLILFLALCFKILYRIHYICCDISLGSSWPWELCSVLYYLYKLNVEFNPYVEPLIPSLMAFGS